MELHIKPFPKNEFPLRGFLIKGVSAASWVLEIQRLKLQWKDVVVYPVPGQLANSVWGCFVLLNRQVQLESIDKNEWCQQVTDTLYIPERSMVSPAMTTKEIDALLSPHIHVYHPDFGLVELSEPLSFKSLLLIPVIHHCTVTRPKAPLFIPEQVRTFQVRPVSPEEMVKQMEEKVFPKKEKMKDEKLSASEKMKLSFYKFLFTKKKGTDTSTGKTGFMSKAESVFSKLLGKSSANDMSDRMQEDFEELDRRNQSNLDKLLDLLKNNPEEALKYAIPLDEGGVKRGGVKSRIDLSKRWFDFSLFGNLSPTKSSSDGGVIDIGSHFGALQSQYHETAEELIRQKQYQKAAFVYMKLLKNYHKAAETMELGRFYQEAATIYIKHANNKKKAAECYERGMMTDEAITLYKELGDDEKVGDLYLNTFRRKEAMMHYEKLVNEYLNKDQNIKASLLCRNKMNDTAQAQAILLKAWIEDRDSFNCLNNYFAHVPNTEALKVQIQTVYNQHVNSKNREAFIKVLQYEYSKDNELNEWIKDMAYETIAQQIRINPAIVSELKVFNKEDRELGKDTLKFILKNKADKKANS